MEKAELRPALPWRKIVSGTYSAETPTGETYVVERTDEGWRVSVRGGKDRREVLGEPTRIKWLAQCRAETHYGGCNQRRPSAEVIKAAAETIKKTPPPRPRAAAKPEATRSTMGRRRRPGKAPPAPKPAPEASEGLALTWKASRENGREYHVAVHEGGRFKILEVKGTEGYALFSESDAGSMEIECGSLGECKQRAEGLKAGYVKETRKDKSGARAKPERTTPPAAKSETRSEKKAEPKAEGEKTSATAEKSPKGEACGCQPAGPAKKDKPKAKAEAVDSAKDKKIVDGLLSALRKIDPAVLKNAGGST